MARTWITFAISSILALIGIGIFTYKIAVLSYPVLPGKDVDSWYVEFSVELEERNRNGVEFSLIKPRDNASYAITNDQLFAPDFGIRETKSRGINIYKLSKGTISGGETVLLRYNIYKIGNQIEIQQPSPRKNDQYLKKNRLSNPDEKTKVVYETIDSILGDAEKKSSGPISFTKQVIKALGEDEDVTQLLTDEMKANTKESVLVKILAAAKIDARTANGFELKHENSSVNIKRWIEVYNKETDSWDRISSSRKDIENLDDYYVWWFGDRDMFKNSLELRHSTKVFIKLNNDSSLMRQIWLEKNANPIVHFLSLQTLPLEQQFVVQILLLLPLGALLISFFRQVIGIQTIGTFMPVLIALSFRETGLIYGILFFFAIISLGLFTRAYITKLHLLMVPRLSAVLSIIVVFIILVMLLAKDQNFSLGISVALFPVVIITMFIERLSTILDEKNPTDAFYGFIGSMALATIIYLCILNDYVMHWMFVFPETLFVVIACCLMLGRYNGYKLTEYWRFKQMKKGAQDV